MILLVVLINLTLEREDYSMEMQLELISNYSQVLENAATFRKILGRAEKIIRKLSNFQHWYYFEELDILAPSKFIGYKSNSYEYYVAGTSEYEGYMDGRDTEVALRDFFVILPKEEDEIYRKKLVEMLAMYNKEPNKRSRIHVKLK